MERRKDERTMLKEISEPAVRKLLNEWVFTLRPACQAAVKNPAPMRSALAGLTEKIVLASTQQEVALHL